MVKFGKKFFFDATYVKKSRRKLIIIGSCVVVLIICLIFGMSKIAKKKKPGGGKVNSNIILRQEIKTEVKSSLPDKASYFEKLENTDLNKIEIIYPDNFETDIDASKCPEGLLGEINSILDGTKEGKIEDYECITKVSKKVGNYDIKVVYDKKDYSVKLNVIDSTPPVLKLKDVAITKGDSYTIDDFVESCTDNYDEACKLDYYYNNYSNSESVDYSKLAEEGTYSIKVAAADSSGNLSMPETATLTISPKAPNKYLVTFDTAGGSAINGEYIEEGKIVTKPSNPTKNGYTFAGWTLNGSTYDFSTPVTSNITLVANWNKNQTTPVNPGNPGNHGNSGSGNSGCQFGNKNYNSKKYLLAVYANGKSSCAVSPSNAQKLKDNSITEPIMYADFKKLAASLKGGSYADPGYEILPVPNNNRTGVVGYQIEVNVQQKVNDKYVEVARYRIDTSGKRHFTLNTINLPE